MEKDLLKTLSLNLPAILEHSITEDYFYSDYGKSLFKKMLEGAENGYKLYPLSEYDKKKLADSKYLLMDNIEGHIAEVRTQSLKYKTFDVLSMATDNLKRDDVRLNEILLTTKDLLTDIEYSNHTDIEVPSALDYLDIYEERTAEMESSDKPVFYEFHSHPLLKEHMRMERGQFGSLIAKTGNGKSVLAIFLAVDFARNYDEEVLFITDENSMRAIYNHMYSHYFKVPTREIQDRTIKINDLVSKLSEKERKEFETVFNRIRVCELSGIPLDKVKSTIKKYENIGLVVVDSFDEVYSLMPNYSEEITRYDRNAKLLEAMAKELNVIILATAQLATQYYTTCASKLPEICNFNSKSLVKKNFFAIVLHFSVDKDGAIINDVIRVVKNRNGMSNFSYKVTKDYSCMQLVADNTFYDYTNITKKADMDLEF